MEKQRIKIAIVVPNLHIAGAQDMVVNIAININTLKFNPVIIVFNRKENNKFQRKLEENRIECLYYGEKDANRVLGKIKQYLWLKKVLNDQKPDIIHSHLDYYFSLLYAMLYKKKIIITIHSQPYRICNKWTRYFFKKLDNMEQIKIVCITEIGKKEFLDYFHVTKDNIYVIPNFIDTKKYLFRNRTFESASKIKFVFIARFHPIKNHQLLINAFNEVLRKIPEAQLILVGKGKLLEQERAHVKELKIEKSVFFMGEIEDVINVLQKADVFVISSDSEAFPITLLEAMAAGMPIISTDVGGIPEILNQNGVLVPKGDIHMLSKAMILLAQNKKMRREYSKKSEELVTQYDTKNVIHQYERVYLEVVENV